MRAGWRCAGGGMYRIGIWTFMSCFMDRYCRQGIKLTLACGIALLAGTAGATNYVWTTTGDGEWSNSARWTPSGVPSTTNDSVTFNAAGQNGDETVYLDGIRTNASMIFTNTGLTTLLGGTFGLPVSQTVRLSTGITVTPGAGAVTLGSGIAGVNVSLGGNQTFRNDSANLLSLASTVSCATPCALTVSGSGNTLIGGSVSSNGGSYVTLNKLGAGILTLSGPNTSTGTTTMSCGTLALDYNEQDNSKLADAAILTIDGGSTVSINGGTHVEVVGGTTLGSGPALITRPSGSAMLRMNTITRGAGATLRLGSDGIAQLDNALVNGIVGPYAIVGGSGTADWASTVSASGQDRAIQSLGMHADFSSDSAASNTLLAGSGTLPGSRTNNTVKITTTGSGQALDLGGFSLASGGLLFTGDNDYAINNGVLLGSTSSTSELVVQQWGAGTLTLNIPVRNLNGDSMLTKVGPGALILGVSNTYSGVTYIHQGTVRLGVDNAFASLSGAGGNVDLGSKMMFLVGTNATSNDFSGVISGSGGITKTGISTQKLSGTNTYTGVTTINQGTLNVAVLGNINTPSGIGCGSVSGSAGDLVIAGGTLRFDTALGGTDTTNGCARTDRLFTIGSASSSTATVDSSATCTDGLNALVFSSTGSVVFGTATESHALVLAGTHNGVDSSDAATRLLSRASTFSPSIGDDAGGHPTRLVKTGAGVWNLAGSNTFSGGATVSAGRLVAGTTNALGNGPVTILNGGEVALTVSGGVYTNAFSIAGTGPNLPSMAAWWATSYAGALAVVNNAVLTGPVTLSGNASITAFQMYSNLVAKVGTLAGPITGNYALTIGGNGGADNGTIILSSSSNDWRGNTILAAGSGQSSHCVYLNNGASEVIPNGTSRGNLVMYGMGDWSRVYYSLNGYNETINGLVSTGSVGSLMVQNNSSTTACTLTLGDADTTATYGGPIQNGSTKALALTKIGAGTQTLSGACSYTGPTSVSNGTLLVSGSLSSTAGVSIHSNSATFAYCGATALTKAVTNSSGGTFRYNAVSNCTGALVWGNGRLAGTNWNGTLSGLVVSNGCVIVPGDGVGTSFTASQTWSPGGVCEVAISNTAASAGTGWSTLAVSGTLDLSGLSTSTPFTIKVMTRDASGAAGAAPVFYPAQSRILPFATFGGLNGSFNKSCFTVDCSSISNGFSGSFKVIQQGYTLALQYSPPGIIIMVQ